MKKLLILMILALPALGFSQGTIGVSKVGSALKFTRLPQSTTSGLGTKAMNTVYLTNINEVAVRGNQIILRNAESDKVLVSFFFADLTTSAKFGQTTAAEWADFVVEMGYVSTSGEAPRYTEAETLVSAQDLTDAYADYGAEIDMRGYNTLGVYVIADVNSSENVFLKALGKHTAASANEYELFSAPALSLWTTGASDFKYYYEFDVGTVPFIQLQAYATVVGATAGDLTIVIEKKWR